METGPPPSGQLNAGGRRRACLQSKHGQQLQKVEPANGGYPDFILEHAGKIKSSRSRRLESVGGCLHLMITLIFTLSSRLCMDAGCEIMTYQWWVGADRAG